MNEFIEGLWEKFSIYIYTIGEGRRLLITEKGLHQAIQTACKAQRNACARVCEEFDLPQNNFDRMATAEITEQDYE